MNEADIRKLIDEAEEAIEKEDIELAIERAEKALELDPSNVDARLVLADLALSEGDAPRVLELAKEILEIDPDEEVARLLLAEGYLLEEQPEKALEICDEALQRDPNNYEARFYMAEALLELGAAFEAAQLYQSIINERSDHGPSLLGLGVALYESCNFDEAHAALKNALTYEPDLPDAHFFIGLIEERKGNESEARHALAMAKELDPEAYPPSIELTIQEFEAVATEVLEVLPPKLKEFLVNVPISVEEIPADADLLSEDPPLSPSLWGLFRGLTRAEEVTDPFAHPPSEIVLYRRNLQRGVRTRQELVEEIKDTMLHEIGHYLGLEEEDLEKLGLG